MPKESGVGVDKLFVSGYDLSGDVGAVQTIATRRNLLDVTGIDKSAIERIPALVDGEISFNAWYNPSALQEHVALSLPTGTGDHVVCYFHGSAVALTGANACLVGKQIDYPPQRGQDGSLAMTLQYLANGSGVDWGDMLTTGKQTYASATNGTSIDYTAVSTAFGAVGYLEVFSVGSGTATVAIQDSADNGTFADITGLVFTGATARTEQRLATAVTATIRRYVRINVTGAFTNAVIAVMFRKFDFAQG